MPDWLIAYLGSIQGGIVRTLATELRAGGLSTAAFGFGAIHALTPGHGKAALAAYFLGTEAPVGKGLRIALTASLLHVLSGFIVFLLIRFTIGSSTFDHRSRIANIHHRRIWTHRSCRCRDVDPEPASHPCRP